jgi:hypothetical protein
MSAERVFQVLLCSGLLAGGWLYGQYWKKAAISSDHEESSGELRSQNAELTRELDETRDELAQVRSLLAQGSLAIPEDLITFVEKDSGMVFPKAPIAKLASPDLLRNAAERNLELLFGKDGVEEDQRAWTTIGLLPPNDILRAQWIAIETIGTRGLFDLRSGEIFLPEDFDPMSIPDSGALVHQLARQLQFQNHPLPKSWKSTDEARAWLAIHRGAAAGVQSRYLRRRAAAEQVDWEDSGDDREALLLQLSPAIQGLANFPYLEGGEYAKKAYLESRDAYLSIFRTPPLSSFKVLYPHLEAIGHPETKEPSQQLGALGIRLLFDPYLGNEAADELAQGWRGDRYQIDISNLNWQVTMATPKLAQTFAESLQRIETEGRSINVDGPLIDISIPFKNDR